MFIIWKIRSIDFVLDWLADGLRIGSVDSVENTDVLPAVTAESLPAVTAESLPAVTVESLPAVASQVLPKVVALDKPQDTLIKKRKRR